MDNKNNNPKNDAGTAILMWLGVYIGLPIVLGLIIMGIATAAGCGGDGANAHNGTVSCQFCHREFAEGSSNAKSINRTNMCTTCYNNYKAAEGALGY